MTAMQIFDLVAQILAVICPFAIAGVGYILTTYSKRVDALEVQVNEALALGQKNQLAIKDGETAMERLRTHVSENFANKIDIQQSLARVHEKIEEGNKKTDLINENVGNKIDQLRRDMQTDIRASLASVKAS